MTPSFSPKLRLAPLWPAALALLAAAGLTLALLPGTLAAGAAEELEATLRLLAPTVPLPPPGGLAPDPGIEDRIVALTQGTPYRITVIALDGRVVADSERNPAQVRAMDNHRGRPEVAAALARGTGRAVRHSDTLDLDTAYAARLVRATDGRAAVVRLALPLESLASLRRHLGGVLLLAAGLAGALTLALSWWLTRTVFRPLSELIARARRMGEGDYRRSGPLPEDGELGTLARALDRIAVFAESQIAAVEAERDHLRSTVASMAEGVLVTDREGRGRLANPAFRSLFRLGAETPAEEVLELARQPRLDDLVAATLANRHPGAADLELLDPAPRHLALHASPLSGGEGAVVVARDVTEAALLDRMRKDFVANVSHELKTPLAAIRGYAESLAEGGALDDRATAERFSARILGQCRRLGALLDDLLTLSRLEGARSLRAVAPVNLRELAAEAVDLVAATARARGLPVTLEPGPSPVVAGDADGLLRLTANLLDNAVKYNRPGGAVRVRLAERADEVTLEVADDGVGIPAAHLPRIFERFYRVDSGRGRDEGGTGLGLAIVKHVAQVHGGRVEVTSEPGVGTTFRVLLPRPGRPA